MLCFHVTVDDDGSSRPRQPTGCTRNPAARATSWFAVDGSERVGVSPRKTADLVKIVTINQIHTTYAWTLSTGYRHRVAEFLRPSGP